MRVRAWAMSATAAAAVVAATAASAGSAGAWGNDPGGENVGSGFITNDEIAIFLENNTGETINCGIYVFPADQVANVVTGAALKNIAFAAYAMNNQLPLNDALAFADTVLPPTSAALFSEQRTVGAGASDVVEFTPTTVAASYAGYVECESPDTVGNSSTEDEDFSGFRIGPESNGGGDPGDPDKPNPWGSVEDIFSS
ncbi:hypothetical protein V1Y59_08370 [Gordonia sp. PKS22-38]|uniref:Uncharacterized protein n=1 Tax=Gordonia prachuapensis TaxID=3115651 RepID=A0ABU7MRY3_9ACTN|nr:hypothetical protein [Gordonia sp. PKS22-38]